MSLQEWFASSLTPPKFIGSLNYQKILTGDPRFTEAFFRTIYFTLIAVTIETCLGVSMAVLFNREFWGKGLVRTLSILPMMATPTAISLIFVMMYHPTLGVMNYLLTVVGLPAWTWTYSSKTALYASALVDVWEWTPLIMLIAMAGLAALPKEPYESAKIDGASGFQFKVILCDDHALIRRGIRDALGELPDVQVVGEAGDYGELRALMHSRPCDVLVLDINLPGRSGLDVLHALKDEGSPVKVLVVSMYPEDQYAIRSLRAGAFGYVNKASDPQTMVQAVRTVAQGRKYVTPEIAQMLVESLTAPATENAHDKLSDRELQTLTLIASDKRLSDIAEELKLSPKTVSVYRARVLEKLALQNNAELTVYAIRNGLVGD